MIESGNMELYAVMLPISHCLSTWYFVSLFSILHVVHSVTIWYSYGFAHKDALYISLSAVFNISTDTDLEVCELELLPLAFSVMCLVDPPAVIVWEVTGVTPPLEGPITRGVSV